MKLVRAISVIFCSFVFGVSCCVVRAQSWIAGADESVVRVLSDRGDGTVMSGTGWVIARGGYIITNYHVVEGGTQQVVLYKDVNNRAQKVN